MKRKFPTYFEIHRKSHDFIDNDDNIEENFQNIEDNSKSTYKFY